MTGSNEALLNQLRLTYDLLPGKAGCDLLDEWSTVLGWFTRFYVPAANDPEVADSHYAYLQTDEAFKALTLGNFYLSGGESVIAKAVCSLLDSGCHFDLQELWRLDSTSRKTIFDAIEAHATN